MTRDEIYENLCVYDPRSEYYKDMIRCGWRPGDISAPRINCYCDNCFKGKDKLAIEILRLMDILESEYITF